MASLHPAAAPFAAAVNRFAAVQASNNPFITRESAPAPIELRTPNVNAPVAESIEVTVLWGTTVLNVEQLMPPRAYAIGEVGDKGGRGTTPEGNVDFAVASEKLGSARRELITLKQGMPVAVFMEGETTRVFEKGQPVDPSGIFIDCSDVAVGARGIELRQDRLVVLEASGLCFRLGGGEKLETVPRAILGNTDRSALVTMSTAALLQGLFVATLAFMTPSLSWGTEDELNKDQLALMQQYLHAAAEREKLDPPPMLDAGNGDKGSPAEAAKGPEGKAGKQDAPQVARRLAIKGDSAERTVGHAELMAEARTIGMISLLNSMNASDTPNSPWSDDIANGPDNANAHGDLFSNEIGDAFGHGLGLTGIGEGGGGRGKGVGMGGIGTCAGLNCYGNGEGFGRSVGRNGNGEPKHADLRMRPGVTQVSGHLPPEVIQRTVRQNFGRFRACYEIGLRSNPNLEGRVQVRFIIGRDGAVSNVSSGGDLPDATVKSCVSSAFYGLSFPAPDDGIVTVTYPIMLQPG